MWFASVPDGPHKETPMEISYDYHDEHHPLYSEDRQLEAMLLRTGLDRNAQEHDTWIAAAVAKAGARGERIASAPVPPSRTR